MRLHPSQEKESQERSGLASMKFERISFRIGLSVLLLVARAALAQQAPIGGAAPATPPPSPAAPVSPIVGAEPGSALESAIQPDDYRLGPGDYLNVAIWGPRPYVYELPVTLEGKLILPNLGVLNVNGLPLGEARELIEERILQDFKGVAVTVTLTRLRKFQIHVLGQVGRPGTYLASAVDRVSSAIGWAGGFTPEASQRGILVQANGEVRAKADLFAFLSRGIARHNPLLQDGDIVYVPFRSEQILVRGAVNQEGPIEFLPGDRFSDAVYFAGGLAADAFIDTLEIARYPGEAQPRQRFFVTVDAVTATDRFGVGHEPEILGTFRPIGARQVEGSGVEYPDFELQGGDVIFVRELPEERRRELVEVQGEVLYPGSYPIVENETRLSEVIRWAGGFTAKAFLEESQIIRRESIRLEDREFARLSEIPVADMTPDEYEYFKVRSRETPGLMVANFVAVFEEGNSEADLLLRRGDLISVATRRDFVSVLGLVADPGNIPFQPGLGVEQYIERAGGFAEQADEGNTRVIRAGTGEWVPADEAKQLNSGDTIWVPEKPDRDYWQIFRDTLTVTAQVLTIYLIADRAVQ